jgi:hypothetical protein
MWPDVHFSTHSPTFNFIPSLLVQLRVQWYHAGLSARFDIILVTFLLFFTFLLGSGYQDSLSSWFLPDPTQGL